MQSNRYIAGQAGAKHYTGPRCRACGGTTRYVVSGACIACTKRRSTERQRAALDAKLRSPKNADT